MTIPADEYIHWLVTQIEFAKEDCKENKGFPNSYGAGYDSGVLRGFTDALEYFVEKKDE